MASRKRAKKPETRQLSVMVIRRIKDMMSLASSVEAYKRRLATAFAKRYARRLHEGEELPDYHLVLDLAVRDAAAALDHLVRLDDAADQVKNRRSGLRKERNCLVRDQLHPQAVAIRGAIDLAFGRKLGTLVHGMSGRTRRKPASLERQVRLAVHLLSSPDLEPPRRKNPRAVVDRAGWSRQLKELHQQLVSLQNEISACGAEHTGLVDQRQTAMAEFDAAYGDALRHVTTAFAMARFDARAIAHLKPYDRRRRLSQRAKKKRQARAAAAAAAAEIGRVDSAGREKVPEQTSEEAESAAGGARATISKTVARWLEKRRVFGT
jgi:hypothetical protein